MVSLSCDAHMARRASARLALGKRGLARQHALRFLSPVSPWPAGAHYPNFPFQVRYLRQVLSLCITVPSLPARDQPRRPRLAIPLRSRKHSLIAPCLKIYLVRGAGAECANLEGKENVTLSASRAIFLRPYSVFLVLRTLALKRECLNASSPEKARKIFPRYAITQSAIHAL